MHRGSLHKPNIIIDSLILTMQDSVDSVLRISSDEGESLSRRRIEVAVALRDFHSMDALTAALSECNAAANGDASQQAHEYHLSWAMFGTCIESGRFVSGQNGPSPQIDRIMTESTFAGLMRRIQSESPLEIQLLSGNIVVATAIVNIEFKRLGLEQFGMSSWCEFKPIDPYRSSLGYDATGSVLFEITLKQADEGVVNGSAQATKMGNLRRGLATAGSDYDDDDFESQDGRPAAANTPQEEQQEQQQEEEEEEEEYEEPADSIHKYRLSIQVSSVGGLKHAANATVHFQYACLGIQGAAVRTRPTWCISHFDTPIHGAVASYSCAMKKADFAQTLAKFPLNIFVESRSNLGYRPMGQSSIPVDAILRSKPHSYRCPVTGKSFRTRRAYTEHRNLIVFMAAKGKMGHKVPPETPIVVRTVDAFYALVAAPDTAANAAPSVGKHAGKVRAIVIIEDLGASFGAQPADGAAASVVTESASADAPPLPAAPMQGVDLLAQQQVLLQQRYQEWEEWQRNAEEKWREGLRQKEMHLRQRISAELAAGLAQQSEDLKRAQEEVARLEVRLRNGIEAADREKVQLELREEQVKTRLSQKTAELQLLQKRVRDEAKARVDAETRRAEVAEARATSAEEARDRAEQRAREVERDYETYRQHVRSMPETTLREELSRSRAQLAEAREAIERERRRSSEVELEREHYKAQMHRLAHALKRERERSSAVARQDLEQLRLEFLAREERCVL